MKPYREGEPYQSVELIVSLTHSKTKELFFSSAFHSFHSCVYAGISIVSRCVCVLIVQNPDSFSNEKEKKHFNFDDVLWILCTFMAFNALPRWMLNKNENEKCFITSKSICRRGWFCSYEFLPSCSVASIWMALRENIHFVESTKWKIKWTELRVADEKLRANERKTFRWRLTEWESVIIMNVISPDGTNGTPQQTSICKLTSFISLKNIGNWRRKSLNVLV